MEKLVEKFLYQQINETSISINNNKQYSECGERQLKIINLIRDLLPDDKKHLIIDLDDLENVQSAIAEKIMYKQGFFDGINSYIEISGNIKIAQKNAQIL